MQKSRRKVSNIEIHKELHALELAPSQLADSCQRRIDSLGSKKRDRQATEIQMNFRKLKRYDRTREGTSGVDVAVADQKGTHP
jgi:hypothetical protein